MSEEKKNQETQNNGQAAVTQTSKKANLKWVLATVAAVAVAAVVGIMAYTNSPGYRAGEKLKLAEKFLEDMDYEQAIANFKLALEIDPNNQEVIALIKGHMDEFYQQARAFAGMGAYASEREIAMLMIGVDSGNILGKIAEAEADCGSGDVQKAKDGFEKILGSNPDNGEIAIVIGDHLDQFYEQARKYGREGEYEPEKELADFMLKTCPDDVRGQIAGAEADSGMGEIEKARDEYWKAVGGGIDEEDVAKGLKYCDAVLKLLEYCEGSGWNEAASYMNTDDFGAVSERLVDGKSIAYSKNTDILVGKSDGGVYVYCGGLNNGGMDGQGVGIVSAVNTCSIYEGGWKANAPSGGGVLTMWNKNEDISGASVYEGDFANGLLNGTALFKTLVGNAPAEITLNIDNGQVNIEKVDDDGNVLVSAAGIPYMLEYETAENNVVTDYAAGLFGFGGSDRILSFKLSDTVPPVMKCNLQLRRPYGGKNPIGKGITASDDVDGDLTAKITNTSRQVANSEGYRDALFYGLEVVYSVADSAGNTSKLTVTYDVSEMCEVWEYRVVSVRW